ncbi:MAG TPA: regulator [Candidatus Hydrogenedentes bacterium]|nr:regulator [Candidatus Hydrogenedentota bacterium]
MSHVFTVIFCISVICITGHVAASANEQGIADTPFAQEYREFHQHEDNSSANDTRAIAVDGDNIVWTATAAGIYRLNKTGVWQNMLESRNAGPAFAAAADANGDVWFGAWNGLYSSNRTGALNKVADVNEPISAIAFCDAQAVAMGPYGLWLCERGRWTKHTGPWANTANAIVCEGDGTFWAATGHGAFQFRGAEIMRHLYDEAALLTNDLKGVAIAPDGAMWLGGFGGLDVYEKGRRKQSYSPREGLPHSDVRRIAFHPDGTLWACTALGVARLKNGAWSLRHSLRWLPSVDVRDVAFDAQGAAWVATARGVAVIKRRMMTLAEKAEHYYRILLERKVRDPWIVGISRLMKQGDVSTSLHEDEDNDGQYTNLYLAMEAFRYQVTGDPEALARARKAAETMELFQTVTGTTGFIARTIVPPEWAAPDTPNPHRLHDRNRTYTERQIADIHTRDPRMKPVEERWRATADGKWLWKGDTSSDEICGHFFGYYIFHEFVAQTEQEKQRVAELARRVMDYIIEGGYVLRDTDGTATRWGVWSPEMLLGNGDWYAERRINATELLCFLKTTAHLTGDEKYEREYRRLMDEYGYLELARAPKPTNPAERTCIDSELLALVFPALLGVETNPVIREAYLQGLHQWFGQVEKDYSPFFNFTCGAYGVKDFGLEKCVAFLRDAPLDLIYWTVDNRQREDVTLVRYPELYGWQTDRLLPASERYVMRWDKNPYDAVNGFDGYCESTGVYWLLPYWMGRYYGFIEAPESQ